MSYGATDGFKTKKALKDAVADRGADAVTVFDTSAFNNRGTVTVASLAGTSAVIVGPDVYSNRRWYANVKRDANGNVKIV